MCYETTNSIHDLFRVDNCLIFLEFFIKDKIKRTGEINILRYDFKSKKVEKINSEPLDGNLMLLSVYKDRLLWATKGLSNIYTTTFDYKDFNYDVDSFFADEYKAKDTYITFELDEPGTQTMTLYKISGDKKEEICKNVSFFMEYADHTIYELALDNRVLIGKDANIPDMRYYKFVENRVYYINNDGTDNKVLCDFGEHYFTGIEKLANYDCYYNEYQLVRFYDYKFIPKAKSQAKKQNTQC